MDSSDEDLLKASCTDAKQFNLIAERHQVGLYRFFARRYPQDAEDLLSETWLQAYRNRASFDPASGTVRGWLFGISRNVLRTHLRAKGPILLELEPGLVDRVQPDVFVSVDQRLDAAAVSGPLREGLKALPEVERELLILTTWEELTPTEAAQVLDIPAGTARSRLHRARLRMQQHLANSSRAAVCTSGAFNE